ncbi:MAG: alanine racemase [Chloroflexota bacterium]
MRSRAWIEVDPAALSHNAGVFRRAIPAGTRLGILVKANGYGHGMVVAARAAVAAGADQLMVVSMEEALALRAADLDGPILIVYPIDPADVDVAVRADLEISVAGPDSARRLMEAWAKRSIQAPDGASLRVHVEVDSGMGRGGVRPEDLASVVAGIDATGGVSIVGVWSHLADGSDPVRSAAQVRVFETALARLAATGRAIPPRHVAATEGVFCGTGPAYDMVRIGLGFYGELGVDIAPTADLARLAGELRPAMTVAARPARLEWVPAGTSIGYAGEWTAERPSLIATLPIGYADGWTRTYWPSASALVRGRRVPLIGRVSMDSVCADVTDVAAASGEVRPDETFVLLGGQGNERITPVDLARLRGSIPNEVFCAFGPRLARRVTGVADEDGG